MTVSVKMMFLMMVIMIGCLQNAEAFRPTSMLSSKFYQSKSLPKNIMKTSTSLQMVDGSEFTPDTMTYAAIFVATLIPSLIFGEFAVILSSLAVNLIMLIYVFLFLAVVKFVGDQADSSRDAISKDAREKFKRSMMETPGVNLAVPTSEEEAIKKQIAKAYMQDKDVDVAVLEEKLRKRAQWRKEMMAQNRASSATEKNEDEEGW